jgi:hypothetical protein
MTQAPEILLEHHLKRLKLPTFRREYQKIARPRRRPLPERKVCARPRAGRRRGTEPRPVPDAPGGIGTDRSRATDGRAPQFKLVRASGSNGPGDHLKAQNAAKFPTTKSLDSFDFKAIPKLNKMQVLELARCDWIERRENVIALGLGLAACQKGMTVSFTTAAALVNELLEARDERRLLRVQKQMANAKLLIIDKLGFV